MYVPTNHHETVLASILMAALPENPDQKWGYSAPTNGLYIRLDIRNDQKWGINAHVLARRYYGGFQVFGCIDNEWSVPEANAFALQSEHDSCWRSDGFAFIGRTAYNKLGRSANVLTITTRPVSDIVTQRRSDYGPNRCTLGSFVAGKVNW